MGAAPETEPRRGRGHGHGGGATPGATGQGAASGGGGGGGAGVRPGRGRELPLSERRLLAGAVGGEELREGRGKEGRGGGRACFFKVSEARGRCAEGLREGAACLPRTACGAPGLDRPAGNQGSGLAVLRRSVSGSGTGQHLWTGGSGPLEAEKGFLGAR